MLGEIAGIAIGMEERESSFVIGSVMLSGSVEKAKRRTKDLVSAYEKFY